MKHHFQRALFIVATALAICGQLTASLCKAANPTIILVHGVNSTGGPNDLRYAYLPMRNWLSKNIPNAKIVDFDWAQGAPDSPAQASIQIGERNDLINGMSAKAWSGSGSLEVISAAQEKSVCSFAHSQETAVAFSAPIPTGN
jgi:hypothetical protein